MSGENQTVRLNAAVDDDHDDGEDNGEEDQNHEDGGMPLSGSLSLGLYSRTSFSL